MSLTSLSVRTSSFRTEVLPSHPRELVLRLSTSEQIPQRAPAPRLTVTFTPDTIDNEHLGRLKSNCCCIYVSPRVWNDRSTWTQNECETEHCRGHTIPIKPTNS